MNKTLQKRLAELEDARQAARRVIIADDAGVMSPITLAEAQRLAGPRDTIIAIEWINVSEEWSTP